MGNCWGTPAKTSHSPTPYPTRPSSPGTSTSISKGSSSQFSRSSGYTSSIEVEYPEGKIMQTPNLRVFTFAELRVAARNFRPDVVLGEGGFGKVYKGWIDEKTQAHPKSGTGKLIAVKKLNSESLQGLQEWQSEVNFLGRLSHPNLVKLLGYCWEDKELLLVYEFMTRGSLENHLFRRGAAFQPLSWSIRLKILLGAAKGLAFLHTSEKKVIYRDFKTSNILLDSDYNPKISDFGLARNGPPGSESHVSTRIMGTSGYAAPEYMASGHLYVKSDVYGFGVVLLEMLSGQRALDPTRPSGQHNLVEWAKPLLMERRKLARLMDPRLEGRYPSKGVLQAAKLTSKCLEQLPNKRPSMKEVVDTLQGIQGMKDRALDSKSGSSHPRNQHPFHQPNMSNHSPLHPRRSADTGGAFAHQTPPRSR